MRWSFQCKTCQKEHTNFLYFTIHYKTHHLKDYTEMLLQQNDALYEIDKLEQEYPDITIPTPLLNWKTKYIEKRV